MKIKSDEVIEPMPDKYKIQNEDAVDKSSEDPLSILKVFERLEIGPVKLEPKRLIAPYRLFYNGKMEQTELIYSYQEPVFDPAEPESRNLADMIAAQVALNYGLFCDAMIFHGLYDGIDRRFIRDMAENTAREIYVKKFLEPNPFLVGPAAGLAPEKRQKYLLAELQFPQTLQRKTKSRAATLVYPQRQTLYSFQRRQRQLVELWPAQRDRPRGSS